MIAAALVLLALAPAQEGPLLRPIEALAAEHAFVETRAARSSVFAGERVRVTVRIGVEESFLRTRMIQPFRRELDVPVQLVAPWFVGTQAPPPGALAADAGAGPGASMSLALNGEVVRAVRAQDLSIDGARYVVLELSRALPPQDPGSLELPPPELVLAYASEFRDDGLRGRIPVDRVDASVFGLPLELQVRPLPELGRPPGFTGAVGRFELEASASPSVVRLGESLALTVAIRGEGELDGFDAPRFEGLERFEILGRVEQRGADVRRIVYDLAPRDEFVERVPALEFSHFDPSPPGAYRTASSAPLDIEVLPGSPRSPGPADSAAAPVPGADPDEDAGGSRAAGALIAVLASLFVVLTLRRRRRRTERGSSPGRGASMAALEAALTASDGDCAQAFSVFLAARLGCAPPAVIAPDLRRRLVRASVPEELAERAARFLELQVAARFGGEQTPDGKRQALELAAELDAALPVEG